MPGSGSGISWGNSSTDRGLLNPIEKEDKMFNETEKEECTFHPELGSNDVLRDTVRALVCRCRSMPPGMLSSRRVARTDKLL